MKIALTAMDGGGEFVLEHDLNFRTEKYDAKHTVVCRLVLIVTFDGTTRNGLWANITDVM